MGPCAIGFVSDRREQRTGDEMKLDSINDASILIWVADGSAPTVPDFEVRAAVTHDSLANAVLHAHVENPLRPEKPWILTSGAIFGPEQIRVLSGLVGETT